MNSRITFTFLIIMLFAFGVEAQVVWGGPGDPNAEFDGGLNDWTTVGTSSVVADSAANAVWIWDEDGSPSEGSFLSNIGPIESPSVMNGAAIFNSDFLDSKGDGIDSLGTGVAPSPHSGELISPIIDLSMESAPNLTFYNYFVNFNATTSVLVSGDGGATFDTYPVNEDVDGGVVSGTRFASINISATAANKDSVVIKFVFSGDYYSWTIDDVAIVSLPGNDLTLEDNSSSPFYTPHSAIQPACAIEIDTFLFSSDISNSGADSIMDMTYKVAIYNNDTDEFIYSDSIVLAEFAPSISDSTVTLPNTWAPEGLVPGIYRIEHSVFNPSNADDFNPDDNQVNQFFEVSEMTFGKEITGTGNIGTWNSGMFYAIGAFYQFGPNCVENYTVASVDYAVGQVGADPDPLVGRPVEFWLWKLTTTLDSFDTSTNYEEDILTVSHPSMEFMAFSIDEIDADDAAADIVVSDEPFLNADGDEVIPMFEAGETYGLFAHWGTNGSTSPLHLFSTTFNTSTDLFYSGGWFGGFTDTKSAPILRLQLKMVSSVDDQPLADAAFKAYPNPTADFLNLELNLETSMNATVTIADVTGRVISYQNLENVQRDVLSINVSNYASGTYLARLATEAGTKTLKFVVE